MKKIDISNRQREDIINDYNNGMSIRKLEKKYPFSFTYLQKLVATINHENKEMVNYPSKDGYYLIAKCKITGKIFEDYRNISGALTTHVQSLYKIDLPSKYKRKSIEYQTGKFWYDSYFIFEHLPNKELKHCKYCEWTTEDILNTSGSYEKHLKQIHNKSLIDYIKDFPDEKSYFKKEIYENLIKCEICGESFKCITNTHLEKHGTNQLEYKLRFGLLPYSENTTSKLKNNYNQFLKNTPFLKTSTIEQKLIDLIGIDFIQSDRKTLNGKEIDLLYGSSGFEINGIIHHTEVFGKKDKNYHLNKTLLAEEKNINLYHIFEDEIIEKPTIVINKIKHILNLKEGFERIHARKCEIISTITNEEKRKFLTEHHIQGNDVSNHNIIARHNGDIIAIMTFNNKRNMNKSNLHESNTYELSRFCVKNGIRCTGIASKLLKYFISNYNPTRIISFADRRWTPNSQNNLYTKLGFELTKILKPDYHYYNPKIHKNKRFHKFGFGKNNLRKRFPAIFDNNKTEWDMMRELGYDRIWDCGKFRYELILY